VGRAGTAALSSLAGGHCLALAGILALGVPLMAQPVSQQGPIDPSAQTVAAPKPNPKTTKKSADSQNAPSDKTAQADSSPGNSAGTGAQGSTQQTWSTKGGYSQGGNPQGATAQGATTPGAAPSQGNPQRPPVQIPFRPDADSSYTPTDEPPVFRSEVRLVRMLATVRDPGGALAGGLKREEFQIVDSGVPQELAVFEATTEQPLSVAILIDCSASTYRAKRTELDSVRAFAKSLFSGGNEADSVALYSFNADVTLETPWTHSYDRVDRALARLQSDGATALYDAVTFASRELTGRRGRHVAIVVTDGSDTFSKSTYQQALEAVHLADAILYATIIVPVAEEPGRNTGGEHALVALAASSGGRAFHPGTQKELDNAFAEILRDLRTQYLLAYYPRGVAATKDRFHEVRLTLTRPGYAVSSRRGYYEPAPAKGFKVVTR